MDSLGELRTFLAIVDQGSFAAAARRLRRSPPTVTRVIAGLEQKLGVRLFDRSSRRSAVTCAGSRLARSARVILDEYDQALALTSGERYVARGNLRVTAPQVFGREYVAPAILEFLDSHPAISIELDLTDRATDVQAEGFDLAVRIGSLADPSLKIRSIGSVRRLIVASPEYLKERGCPRSLADLAHHEILLHGEIGRSPWRFRRGRQSVTIPITSRYSVNQPDAALAAARSGRGLVTVISYQVHDDIRTGRLTPILEDLEIEPLPVRLAWPDGRDQLLRLRLLIDHLAPLLTRLPVVR